MKTDSTVYGSINSSITFSYQPNRNIRFLPMTPNSVNWTGVQTTDKYEESTNNLTIENCGNDRIANDTIYHLWINATKLTSGTTLETISASNFTAKEGPATACSVPFSKYGNFTEAQYTNLTFDLGKSNGVSSNKMVGFCLNQLPNVQSNQNFSSPQPWVIEDKYG
jgi:hypothetical protein